MFSSLVQVLHDMRPYPVQFGTKSAVDTNISATAYAPVCSNAAAWRMLVATSTNSRTLSKLHVMQAMCPDGDKE